MACTALLNTTLAKPVSMQPIPMFLIVIIVTYCCDKSFFAVHCTNNQNKLTQGIVLLCPEKHVFSRFGLMIMVVSTLLAVTFSAHAQSFSPYAYVEPPYSSFVVGYAQLPFDDYSNTASDINS